MELTHFYQRFRHNQAFTTWSIPRALKYAEWDFQRTDRMTLSGTAITAFSEPVAGQSFAQGVAADQPALSPPSTVRSGTFDGTDFLQSSATLATLGWPTGGAFEVWGLVQYTGAYASSENPIFCYPANTVNTSLRFVLVGSGGRKKFRFRVGEGATNVNLLDESTNFLDGLPHIIRAVSTGSQIRIDVDGIEGTPVACVAGGFTGTARSTIGGQATITPTDFFVGKINFLGFYRPLPAIYAAGLYAMLEARRSALAITGDWPWNDPDTIADLELKAGQFWSGLLGNITAAQALVSTRASSTLAFDSNGLLQSFAANVPAIASGRGLWAQTGSSGRIDFNNDLANAAWVKTNMTVAQDLPSPFAAGTPAGWRIAATAPNAAIAQSYTTPAPGATFNFFIPSAMFYWDGTPLGGAIQISQDNFVTVLDIRSQLVAGKWVQIAGLVKELPNPPIAETVGVRIAASGDSVGFCLANVERNYVMTPPILVPAALSVNRATDYTELITANFPTLATASRPQFTVLMVVEPQMKPLPPFGSATQPRTGWTALEINNEYNISGEGIGELTPYGGAGEGSLMTLDSVLPGADIQVGHRLVVENGVGSFSDITSQESGTPGGAGTYRVFSPIWPDGQTTPTNIAIQVRYRDAQGYGLNAALKPDDPERPWAQRIGVTFTAEPELDEFGNDPQQVDFVFNEPNAEGWTVDTAGLTGVVALKGDVEIVHADQFTHAPQLESDLIVTVGTQYPAAAGSLDGPIFRLIIVGRLFSAEEMSAATAVLQQRYTT